MTQHISEIDGKLLHKDSADIDQTILIAPSCCDFMLTPFQNSGHGSTKKVNSNFWVLPVSKGAILLSILLPVVSVVANTAAFANGVLNTATAQKQPELGQASTSGQMTSGAQAFNQTSVNPSLTNPNLAAPTLTHPNLAVQNLATQNPTAQNLATRSSTTTNYTGEPISINFQNVEVRSALHILSEFTGLNIIASDQVRGTIMLNLVNVPWDQALDIILTAKHLGMQRQGNVLFVSPLSEIAEQHGGASLPLYSAYIRPNYAKAADIMALISKASQFKSAGLAPINVNTAASNTAIAATNGSHSNAAVASGVVNASSMSLTPNQQTQHHAATLLSKRGVIAVDERTNTLIIKDTAPSIENIKALIRQVDIPVRQVMIEARIVSASDSFSKEIGVKWGILSQGVATNNGLLVGGSDQTLADLKQFSLQKTSYKGQPIVKANYNITRPDHLNVDLGVTSPAGRIAFGLLSLSDFMIDLELSAMQAEGRGEVISTPKILTLDKQTAKVSSGTKIPYQGESEGGGTTTQFEEAVLSLEVTPNITPDDQISLQIRIENGRPNPVSGGVVLIDTDTLSTNVTVAAGQTIVLGGIYRNQIFNNVEKVPFFGDIPYLGRLFKKDVRRNDQQELLIFITPKLMNDSFLVTDEQQSLQHGLDN